MPIFCFDVNFAVDGKLVPITRRISTSIGPVAEEIVLKRVEGSSENGTSLLKKALSEHFGSAVHHSFGNHSQDI